MAQSTRVVIRQIVELEIDATRIATCAALTSKRCDTIGQMRRLTPGLSGYHGVQDAKRTRHYRDLVRTRSLAAALYASLEVGRWLH